MPTRGRALASPFLSDKSHFRDYTDSRQMLWSNNQEPPKHANFRYYFLPCNHWVLRMDCRTFLIPKLQQSFCLSDLQSWVSPGRGLPALGVLLWRPRWTPKRALSLRTKSRRCPVWWRGCSPVRVSASHLDTLAWCRDRSLRPALHRHRHRMELAADVQRGSPPLWAFHTHIPEGRQLYKLTLFNGM